MRRNPGLHSLSTKLIGVAILLFAPSLLAAQSVPASRLAVDTVTTIDSKRYRGIVVENSRDHGLSIVVERAWFEKTYGRAYDRFVEKEKAERKEGLQAIIDDATNWTEERKDDGILVVFLREEKDRLQKQLDGEIDLSDKKFALIQFAPHEVKEAFILSDDRHLIAAAAWHSDFKDVSTRSVDSIRNELNRKKIDPSSLSIDFSADLPVTSQTLEQLAARRALVEYNLRGQLEFQGTNDFLVRKSPDAAVPIGALLGQMLRGGNSVNDLLKDLGLPEGRDEVIQQTQQDKREEAFRKATAEAEADGFRGMLISRMDQDFNSPEVTVECEFCAMVQPGKWITVGRFIGQAKLADQEIEDMDDIKDDPQIKQVLEMAQALGVGDQSLLDKALRHGSATRQATLDAQTLFLDFVNQYRHRLDSPPIFPMGR